MLLAVVLAVLEETRIQFDFRPYLAQHVILEGVVPGIGAAADIRVGGGEADANGSLSVKVTKTFSICDGRRNDGAQGAVCVAPRGDAPA